MPAVSRRIVAPLLLLLASALSLAAVFVVHGIEARGGPVGQPSVTSPYFSPNGDGVQDKVKIAFTTHRRERITVKIVDADDGQFVRELLHRVRVDGRRIVEWNGRQESGLDAPDGRYKVRISRAGDSRVYEPITPIVLDTEAPVGRLDQVSLVDGQLRGLALLGPGTKLVVELDGKLVEGTRNFAPRPGAVSGRPTGPVPKGTHVIRFVASVGDTPNGLALFAQDKAGNRTELPFELRHSVALDMDSLA
jgi:hypothetical protein